MPNLSRSPTYNLKAVLKETGLKADVLRAWERRYELPRPQRTQGGHRLYSEYDIETVKWLRARQAEGLSISRAVDMWKDMAQSGLDPLAATASAGAPPPPSLPAAGLPMDLLRQSWLEANLAFDGQRVDELLNQAFALYPVETVCTEILQKGLSEIGNHWYQGVASVQQEHFASALATRRLEAMLASTPPPTRRQTVIVGCPPNERHTFSALLLSLFLGRRGLKVIYLGADVPLERLEETTAAVQANLIILAAQQLTAAAALLSTAVALRSQAVTLAYGGLIFNRLPGLRARIPAHFLGESLPEAVQEAERLLAAPGPSPAVLPVDNPHQVLAARYREQRPEIERQVLEDLRVADRQFEHIHAANLFFGDELSAALALGDVAWIESDLHWIRRLLTSRYPYSDWLPPYLAAYRRALSKVLGSAANSLTVWIDEQVARLDNGQPHISSLAAPIGS